jgi:alpha/beta hydrolase family protein
MRVIRQTFRASTTRALTLVAALLALATPAQARVTRIVIDARVSPAFGGQSFGTVGQYETIAGRAFGELDPDHRLNAIIQDVELGKDPDGKVRYVATFFLVKPVDMSKSSGLLWHDVPNRGGRITLAADSRADGDIGLSSGWQGDNSGGTDQTRTTNDWVQVPVARNADGSSVTGLVLGRIVNRGGQNSQPILVQANPLPYRPATLDTTQAKLVSRVHETMDGVVSGETEIASADWRWAKCDATHPFPGAPDPTQICLRNGFDPARLYEVVFTAKDPYVLGVGFAAFRDVASFFKNGRQDDAGTPNPVAGGVSWVISRGVSQSGNFLRGFLHLGFNQDEAGRRVHDGAWPIIAGRRIALNFRWAQPDGVLELYQAGSEGPQWWRPWPDRVRGLPTRGILDRCRATHTCPKVVEHFGAAEIWALKLGIEWVGTDAMHDIPIPDNVRRYYIPSTTHGGGAGGFSESPPANVVNCPGNNYGQGRLRANPVPHTQTVNALRVHFRNWVMHGVEPPPSVYPTLGAGERDDERGARRERDGDRRHGFLVEPTKAAMGFPSGIPGLPATVPEAASIGGKAERPFINPVLDYDWGPGFNPSDGSGVPTNVPPPIKQVIPMVVPRVDADGNELGGVPVVLRDAPLGTYVGWNITAAGFHKDQICNYVGGMIPFARTRAERLATSDPRLSLEERYGNHAGYVAAVQAAAANAVARRFLLQKDADDLVAQAAASDVLNP